MIRLRRCVFSTAALKFGSLDASEIVVHVVKGDHRLVVVELLGEGVRQPREAAHVHPHREVLALDVAGRDVGRIRVAADLYLARARALGRAVTLLGARALP
jgi:hypothetical protein